MRKNHSKIVCIKLVHLLTYVYVARSHIKRSKQSDAETLNIYVCMAHAQQAVNITFLRSHYWHLGIYPTIAPRLCTLAKTKYMSAVCRRS